jgi:hypothetical protein
MKKLIAIFVATGACFVLTSCGVFELDSSTEAGIMVTVTFKQDGKADIIKTIKKGGNLTDIPSPDNKTGYTVTWNRTDFTAIQTDITVTATYTVNTYTVLLNANNGTNFQSTFTVTYGTSYTLRAPTPQNDSYTFLYWTYNGQKVNSTGVWDIDEADGTIQLDAQWELYTSDF